MHKTLTSKMQLKEKQEDYSEKEFLEFISKIWNVDTKNEEEHDALIDHFTKITEHPRGNGVLFYPEPEMEESPQGVVDFIKNWRAANGKPGFKQDSSHLHTSVTIT